MIIVDAGRFNAFQAVMEARDYILTMGYSVVPEQIIEIFKERNNPEEMEKIEALLKDHEISAKEKYYIFKEMVGFLRTRINSNGNF